jgi:hypothetical protein
MKTKAKVLAAIATAATVVGLAHATPIVNLASPLFSVGQHPSDIKAHGVGKTPNGQWFEVRLTRIAKRQPTTRVIHGQKAANCTTSAC